MGRFVAAAVQMRSGTSVERNVADMEELVREAAKLGATYIQTPEMTGGLLRDRAQLLAQLRDEANDKVAQAASRLAAELGVTIHIGSTAIGLPDGLIANRALIYGRDGQKLTHYDKIHMFDVDLDKGESWRESATFKPGEFAKAVKIDGTLFGLAICYDLRFPHLFRTQALHGASILTVPAAFTRQTGEAHWHVLLRARAIENGAFVIAAAQGGVHEDGRETYGHSLIIDPWGKVLAEASGDEPGVIIAQIDPQLSAATRQKIPNLKNARDFTFELVDDTSKILVSS